MLLIVQLILKRVWANRWLSLGSIVGLAVVIGVVSCIPIFARGVNLVLMRTELTNQAASTGRPLFSLRFYHSGSYDNPLQFDGYKRLDDYFTKQSSSELGLPMTRVVRTAQSEQFSMFPLDGSHYKDSTNKSVGQVSFGFMSDVDAHIVVTEGSAAPAVDANAKEIPVLVEDTLQERIGIHAGEHYRLVATQPTAQSPAVQIETDIPIVVTGVWAAKDPKDTYWFDTPSSLLDMLLVPESTFRARIAPIFWDSFPFASWYLNFDSSNVQTDDVPQLLQNMGAMRNRANNMVRETRLDYSPTEPLQQYEDRTQVLTILLYTFSIPILGLVLAFPALIAGLLVDKRKAETAILLSRGSGRLQVVALQAGEGLVLSLVAIPLGLALGTGLARLMGSTLSFMLFVDRPPLPIAITPKTWPFVAGAIGLGILAHIAPEISRVRLSIVNFNRERSRPTRSSFWQRYFLDVLLLAAAVYGYTRLRDRSALFVSTGSTGDPFREPVLFLAPSFFALAVALVLIRLFPLLILLLAKVSEFVGGPAAFIAFRYLARAPSRYAGSFLLIVLTSTLAVFTVSMAKTLDTNTVERIKYEVGADLTVYEKPQDFGTTRGPDQQGMSPEEQQQAMQELTGYMLDVHDQTNIPGVLDAARVARYTVQADTPSRLVNAELIGVDRADFERVAYFRQDFASVPLGGLMNLLGVYENGVLVPRDFLNRYALAIGARLPVDMSLFSGQEKIDFTVAGTYDYFPTVYPNKPPTLITNLDYVFSATSEVEPYEVWFTLAPNARTTTVLDGIKAMHLPVASFVDVRPLLSDRLAQPERIGLFGTLSIGYIASAVLTTIGFALYALASFRSRAVEMAILRAIGLSAGQLTVIILVEQFIIVTVGAMAGLALGMEASRLFIPFFRVGTTVESVTPPFQIILDWQQTAVVLAAFAGVLTVTSLGITWRIARSRLFEAVKLGGIE